MNNLKINLICHINIYYTNLIVKKSNTPIYLLFFVLLCLFGCIVRLKSFCCFVVHFNLYVLNSTAVVNIIK